MVRAQAVTDMVGWVQDHATLALVLCVEAAQAESYEVTWSDAALRSLLQEVATVETLRSTSWDSITTSWEMRSITELPERLRHSTVMSLTRLCFGENKAAFVNNVTVN